MMQLIILFKSSIKEKRSELGREQKMGMQRRRQYMKACLEGHNLKGDL